MFAVRSGESSNPAIQLKLQRFLLCFNELSNVSPLEYDNMTARDVDELAIMLSEKILDTNRRREREANKHKQSMG